MKLFLIGAMLFSGGSAVAYQNETVQETVSERYQQVRENVQNRFKKNVKETVQETGFPYPSEAYLATLTDEQSTAILTFIDQVNATYDWTNMSDEEITEALLIVKDECAALYAELGLESPAVKINERINKRSKEILKDQMVSRLIENLKENGLEFPSEQALEYLTDDQVLAITTQVDEYNATYDWANMTDEEILAAMELIKVELQELRTELGIERPVKEESSQYQRRGKRNQETPDTTDDEGSDIA